MEIRDRVRKFRNEKGLSTNDLSKLTDISQSTLSKIENGKRKIDTDILQKIADALEVSIDRLTGESVYSIIEDRLEEKGMTFEDVEKISGVSAYWLRNLDGWIPGGGFGESKFDYYWITQAAEALGLPPEMLRTALARQERRIPLSGKISATSKASGSLTTQRDIPEIFPLPEKVHRIPVLGSIPAGSPVEAVENILEWIEIPEEWIRGGREYFGLTVTDDSMYPEYMDNDIAVIRKQSFCDSGDDCAVMVDAADATLKRVNIQGDSIELEAINKMYGKRKFTNKEVKGIPVRILGVVVELRRKKKK